MVAAKKFAAVNKYTNTPIHQCINIQQIHKYKYINNVPAMKSGLGQKLCCIQLLTLLLVAIIVSYCLLQHIKCWLFP